MTLTLLRQIAKGRYGLERGTTADGLFTDAVLNDLINEAHRWLAREAWLYKERDRTETLVSGTGRYPLDIDVIRLDENSLRINYASTDSLLIGRREGSLLYDVGPFESVANGRPVSWFSEQGELANDEQVVVNLIPKPGAAGTLYYACWVYGAELSADGDRPTFSAHEHDRLIPIICWKMAEVERARGRADAPVEYFAAAAQAAKDELAKIRQRPTMVSGLEAVATR